METGKKNTDIVISEPKVTERIDKMPFMGWIFAKALWYGVVRPNSLKPGTTVEAFKFTLTGFNIDTEQLAAYCKVCGFTDVNRTTIPISYFQSLFVGLIGKSITSKTFPINPLGLIHTFQSMRLYRAVQTDEILDFACELSSMRHTEKGIESEFKLEVHSGDESVWQGVSVFLTKTVPKKKVAKQNRKPDPFDKKEEIKVKTGTGRQYARVSKDYNPHHLYDIPAKIFGFKKAIVHGMWSLARVVASLDNSFDLNKREIQINAFFKRPIFMPAVIALGYSTDDKTNSGSISFLLKDNESSVPHIRGELIQQIIKEKN